MMSTAVAEPEIAPNDTRQNRLEWILLQKEKERRRCERSYEQFVKSAWDVLEPENPLEWNWHLTYLCNVVQSEIERIGRREDKIWDIIIVNIPPRTLKSMIFTRMIAAWAWIRFPWMRFMTGSYAEAIAVDHALECRDIIRSEWYQEYWGDRYHLKTDADAKSNYRTNYNGGRFTFATNSKATGRGGNVFIWDDPISVEESESDTQTDTANKRWTKTFRNRLNNKRIDVHIIVMQRLSENDPTGYIIKNKKTERILHICLPAELREWVSPPELKEHYINKLLFPQRLSAEFLLGEQSDAFYYSGQYLQNPTPEEGGMFKRRGWRYWQYPGQHLTPIVERVGDLVFYCEVVDRPDSFDDLVTSWDMAFKNEKDSDEVSGHAVGCKGAQFYVLEKEFYDKLSFAESVEGVVALNAAFPMQSQTLIEDRANGSAVIQTLKDSIPNIRGVSATGTDSPYSRANAVSKIQRAGNMILPHPDICPWSKRIVDNFAAYPKGHADHEVVSICQGVTYLRFNKPVWASARAKQQNIKINWRRLPQEINLYISQWVMADNASSVVLACFNQHTGKLFILDDIAISSSHADLVLHAVNLKIRLITGGVLANHDKWTWIGNGRMFGRENNSGAAASSMKKNVMADAYSESRIQVQDNSFYDERGSVALVDKLFVSKSIFFDQRAIESNRQCCGWNYEGDKAAPGYGMARAITNIVFSLSYTGKFEKKLPRMSEYSPAKEQFEKQLDWAERAGQLEEFLRNRTVRKTSSTSKDGWMQ